jgi:hypothetical protein
MAFQLGLNNTSSAQQSVSYDADNVCLLGSFNDELTSYRTRREWVDILANYFLLEKDRDYTLEIEAKEGQEEANFQLKCVFTSACGRYAFWRLINRQAPEAERLLGARSNNKEGFDSLFGSIWRGEDLEIDDAWLIEELEDRKGWCPNFLSSAFKKINRLI